MSKNVLPLSWSRLISIAAWTEKTFSKILSHIFIDRTKLWDIAQKTSGRGGLLFFIKFIINPLGRKLF
jgi:hypothetical protein